MTTRACEPPPGLSDAACDRVSAVMYDILSRNPERFGASFAAGRDTEATPSSAPARISSIPTAPGRAQRTAATRGRVHPLPPVPAAVAIGDH